MLVVEILVYLTFATIVAATLVYLFTRDRRYLRFIVQVVKFAIVVLACVLFLYLFERIIVRL